MSSKLVKAASSGKLKLLRQLIDDQPASVNMANTRGMTALSAAIESMEYECIDLLLERGANVNMSPNGMSAVFVAMNLGQEKLVIDMVNKYHADCNLHFPNGMYLVHMAVQQEMAGLFRTLARKEDCEVNRPTTSGGESILHFAIESDREVFVDEILTAGRGRIDLNLLDNSDASPTWMAIERGAFSIAKLLLSRGADINHRCCNDQTIAHLIYSRYPPHPDQSDDDSSSEQKYHELLAEFNADLEIRDAFGQTPNDVAQQSLETQMEEEKRAEEELRMQQEIEKMRKRAANRRKQERIVTLDSALAEWLEETGFGELGDLMLTNSLNYSNLMHMNEYKLRKMLGHSKLTPKAKEVFLDTWYQKRKEMGVEDEVDKMKMLSPSSKRNDGLPNECDVHVRSFLREHKLVRLVQLFEDHEITNLNHVVTLRSEWMEEYILDPDMKFALIDAVKMLRKEVANSVQEQMDQERAQLRRRETHSWLENLLFNPLRLLLGILAVFFIFSLFLFLFVGNPVTKKTNGSKMDL